MRFWWHGGLVLGLALTWLACEGEARRNDDDDSTSSAGGGTTTTTGGGGNVTDCVSQGPCFVEGSRCTDNGCCPCAYECRAGRWQQDECAGCAGPACQDLPPQDGAACNLCADLNECVYDQCVDGGEIIRATCDGTRWSVQSSACP
jgi:hypothetical protein